jgi:hypothetical protein
MVNKAGISHFLLSGGGKTQCTQTTAVIGFVCAISAMKKMTPIGMKCGLTIGLDNYNNQPAGVSDERNMVESLL